MKRPGSGNSYTKPGVAFTAQATTTGTRPPLLSPPPLTLPPPAVDSARVNGAVLALFFDAPLDDASAPPATAFAVSVAGSARTVSAVAVSGYMVTLTLGEAVTSGQGVTVGYMPPASGKLRGAGGGSDVAAFSGQAVINDTPAQQQQVQQQAPLTAAFGSAPAEHRGKGRFTMRIAFSDPVTVGASAAAATIAVSGGELKSAKRAQRRGEPRQPVLLQRVRVADRARRLAVGDRRALRLAQHQRKRLRALVVRVVEQRHRHRLRRLARREGQLAPGAPVAGVTRSPRMPTAASVIVRSVP